MLVLSNEPTALNLKIELTAFGKLLWNLFYLIC